jgi:hypothetical protein
MIMGPLPVQPGRCVELCCMHDADLCCTCKAVLRSSDPPALSLFMRLWLQLGGNVLIIDDCTFQVSNFR